MAIDKWNFQKKYHGHVMAYIRAVIKVRRDSTAQLLDSLLTNELGIKETPNVYVLNIICMVTLDTCHEQKKPMVVGLAARDTIGHYIAAALCTSLYNAILENTGACASTILTSMNMMMHADGADEETHARAYEQYQEAWQVLDVEVLKQGKDLAWEMLASAWEQMHRVPESIPQFERVLAELVENTSQVTAPKHEVSMDDVEKTVEEFLGKMMKGGADGKDA